MGAKKIAMGLGAAVLVGVGGVAGLAATKPDTFSLERSLVIQAPPSRIYAQLEDFHAWQKWSPWEGIDANLKREYTGKDWGLGAEYGWEGEKTGKGHMKVVEAQSPTFLKIQLDFIQPFEAHNFAEFTLTPEGEGTKVRWVMHGPQPFMSKVMGVFMSMDAMVGPDFEKGLGQLKAVAEKQG